MDLDSQTDELMALASIYEDSFIEEKSEECIGGQLAITFDVTEAIPLIVDVGAVKSKNTIKLNYLPPLYLNFNYPEDYPSINPPKYTLSCKWISRSKLSRLCQELDKIWDDNKGEVVLFLWSQYIKDSTLELLQMDKSIKLSETKPILDKPSLNISVETEPVDKETIDSSPCSSDLEISVDPRTFQDVHPNTNMLKLLRDFDIDAETIEFNKKSFECKVCFAEKSGKLCLKFWPCGHIYCKGCMTDYFEVQIKEGNVKLLRCPNDKCTSEANPKQVEALVSKDLYDRWDRLLLSTTLSSLGDTQPCPRVHCQYPVTMDKEQGSCPSCTFVFCGLCRAGWHGVEPCKLNKVNMSEIMEWYSSGDGKVKRQLEAKYGKKQLEKIHNEHLSLSYLKDNAKRCPRCNANIEKTEGCNKMTCHNCRTSFCWLCMKLLNAANPYDHFNQSGGQCANRLFEGVEEDDEDFLDEYFDENEFGHLIELDEHGLPIEYIDYYDSDSD